MERHVIQAAARLLDLEQAAAPKTGVNPAVTALVSAYDVKYRIGYYTSHTLVAGAFTDAITARDGKPFPIYLEHNTEAAPIGSGVATETAEGLQMRVTFYVNEDDSGEVARIYASVIDQALEEWSIGYIVEETRLDPEDQDHFFVTKAGLFETSLVLRGANPGTKTLALASAERGALINDITEKVLSKLAPPPAAASNPPETSEAEPSEADQEALDAAWDRIRTAHLLR